MTKLGLAIIAGPDDVEDLDRCLSSCCPSGLPALFDTIHVTAACPEHHPGIENLAGQYGAGYDWFKWVDDFAGARNHSFGKVLPQVDWIMWLDTDDRLSEQAYRSLLDLKSKLDSLPYDAHLMHYAYSHAPDGSPALVLPRERILRASKAPTWHDPIHEYINILDWRKLNHDITIDHWRRRPPNKDRNIKILKAQYEKNPGDPRIRFYYAKELLDWGDASGLPIMERHIALGEGFPDNIQIGCIKVGNAYLQSGNLEAARRYGWTGRSYSTNYAELDVMLGMIAEQEGDWQMARRWYEEALTKRVGTAGMSQLPEFYGFIPKCRLAYVLGQLGRVAEGRQMAQALLTDHPQHEGLKQVAGWLDQAAAGQMTNRTLLDGDIQWIRKKLGDNSYTIDVVSDVGGVATAEIRKKRKLAATWILPSQRDTDGVTRIRYLQVAKALPWAKISAGIDVSTDLVIVPQGAHACIKELKSRGKLVIADLCEGIVDDRLADLAQADMVTVCSTALATMLIDRGIPRPVVIPDAIEKVTCGPHDYHQYGDKPLAIFMGYGGNSWLASSWLRPTVEAAGWRLVVCSEWEDADVKWAKETWQETLNGADAVILPHRPAQQAKSNNRLTQAMAMGLPTLSTPIPAYEAVVKHGQNGYLCRAAAEWKQALEALKDESTRRKIGEAAKASVGDYDLSRVAGQWQTACDLVLQRRWQPQKSQLVSKVVQPVDIVIPVYGGLDYLKLCLESIWLETSYPYRVIISDAGSGEDVWQYLRTLQGVTVLGKPGERKNFAEACNAGIRAGTSPYVVVMNSDIVVSRDWLQRMVQRMQTADRLAALNGLSNCDIGFRHAPGEFDMKVSDALVLRPGMKLQEVASHLEALREWMASQNEKNVNKIKPVEWCAAYCTMYARSALQEVGLFDPEFKSGCEDLDLGRRLKAAGFRSGHDFGIFIFHFGGVSRYADQQSRKAEYDAEDKKNHDLYLSKWAKKRVAIWTGPAYEPWDRATVLSGMAGSETWACELATEFVRRGIEVTLYGDTDKPAYVDDQGVRWVDHDNLLSDIQYRWYDEFIASRAMTPVAISNHSTRSWLMIHDIFIVGGAGVDVMPWKVAGYGFLSSWHREHLLKTHKALPADKLFKTCNGVDQSLYDLDLPKKNMTVWSSSLDRGLMQLLKILPRIRKEIPDFEVHVCYGTLNWKKAIEERNDMAGAKMLAEVERLMKQDGVVYHGRVAKAELARLQCQAKVWLYPGWFWETFSITAVENGLARNVLVCTDLAGLQDTVGSAGMLLPSVGVDGNREGDYPESFNQSVVDCAVRSCQDDAWRTEMASKARLKMQGYSWAKSADTWLERFKWA